MKKILALLLVAVMIVSFCAACAKTEAPSTETETSTTESTTTETTETTDTEEVPDAATLVSDAFIDPLADWSQYDELIAEIKAETDFAHRTELMHEAEDILMSNWCVLPFYYYNDIYMMKDYVCQRLWHKVLPRSQDDQWLRHASRQHRFRARIPRPGSELLR